MSVSAIMVTYNSYVLTSRLLPSLVTGIGKELAELVVVDSASPDKTGEKLKQEFPAVKYIPMPENRGYGTAANAGAKDATGNWLLILNGDVEISPAQVKKLEKLAIKFGADFIAPAQADPQGNLIPIVRNFPTPFTILFARRSPLGKLLGTRGGYLRPLPEKTERVNGFVGGACFLIKKEKFSEIGGFDPQFFLFSEDVDLCKRLADTGGKIFYTPEVTVKHFWSSSTGQDYHASLKQMHQSLLLYFKKHFPGRRLSRLFLSFLFIVDRVLARIYRPSR